VTVARPAAGYGGMGASFNAASPLLFNTTLHGVDQALILPGSADDYASIESVNLLDADTAHLHQSKGRWVQYTNTSNATIVQSTALTPEIGDYHGQCEVTAGGVTFAGVYTGGGDSLFPVEASTEYSLSARMATEASGRKAKVRIDWYNSSKVFLASSVYGDVTNLTADTWATATLTATSHASAAYANVQLVWEDADEVDNLPVGEKYYFDKVCLRPGSDTTFVPTINIVGDLDVRWRGSWRDWTPGGNGSTLAARYASGDLAWTVGTDSSDHLCSIMSDDGSATEEDTAGAAPTVGDMEPLSVRALIVPGGTSETLFQASDDADLTAASWSTVGSGQTTAKTSIHSAGDEPITIGYRQGAGSGADEQPMVVHGLQVRDGNAGPIVSEVDFTDSGVWAAGDTTAETDQGQTVTIHQGSLTGSEANIVDKSCWVGGDPASTYKIEWADADALDFDATQDGTWSAALTWQGATDATWRYPMYKASGGAWYLGWRNNGTRMTVSDGVDAVNEYGPTPTGDTYFVVGGVLDRTAEEVESFLDGVGSGAPEDTTAVGSMENAAALLAMSGMGGLYHWFAIFRSALTDAEMAELGGWDGTVANEPTWLRTAAALYVNADDYRQARNYTEHNAAINLATLRRGGSSLKQPSGKHGTTTPPGRSPTSPATSKP
jgi:hypothetical protein